MRTTTMKQRAGIDQTDAPMTMTKQLMEQFINSLKAGGRQKQTIRTYRRSLEDFYDFLPKDKKITADSLKEWKEHLRSYGYSDSTVNIRLTSLNGFLRYYEREELVTAHNRIAPDESMPEMTRAEYLQYLSKVREIGSEKSYFLIKVFGSIDVSIGELEYLTVEACQAGKVFLPEGKRAEIPSCLREELLQYAERHEITGGPIFVTRTGCLMDRSNITNTLHRLAQRVGMDPGKCCPSALHRVYLTTQRELIEQFRPIWNQSYESILYTEQALVGWKMQ